MEDCPICKRRNHCTANESCWCMTVPISREALSLVPNELWDKVCICQLCAEKYAEKKPIHVNISHINRSL